ncbi:MAG TPA: hypothetical protein VGY66_01290 [Gemmataceae bacterium]|nr:hypothetical protein [Gemmataceae bacterium]
MTKVMKFSVPNWHIFFPVAVSQTAMPMKLALTVAASLPSTESARGSSRSSGNRSMRFAVAAS